MGTSVLFVCPWDLASACGRQACVLANGAQEKVLLLAACTAFGGRFLLK